MFYIKEQYIKMSNILIVYLPTNPHSPFNPLVPFKPGSPSIPKHPKYPFVLLFKN